MGHDRRSPAPRLAQERLDDHATIDRLADELLPALVAKLGANDLGELEVREGTWRVRLRMPVGAHVAGGRRPTSVPRQGARATDAPRGEHLRAETAGSAGAGHAAGSGHVATGLAAGGPGHAPEAAAAAGPSRIVAASPAVGYFRPRDDLRAGTKVRAGDRIGSVDVLGIGQDLLAPGDGLIGATLVAPGEPVEYGQAVIVLEQLAEARASVPSAIAAESGPASIDGPAAESGPAAEPGPVDEPGPAGPAAAPGPGAA